MVFDFHCRQISAAGLVAGLFPMGRLRFVNAQSELRRIIQIQRPASLLQGFFRHSAFKKDLPDATVFFLS
ncbi:hypothetical protein [Paracoccus benzoatiresistens]|uniref:Uncharacterized protein n=1 Tax=Paracoccus benzoatiresistens TaxID=2997341 RepID=A0ABT4J7U9_9RHOB|nr:hypothetical protein [Paracoccus sp. EF6]MCZ0963195.1 hypothetical protein [Paracoccus sp. EF6]